MQVATAMPVEATSTSSLGVPPVEMPATLPFLEPVFLGLVVLAAPCRCVRGLARQQLEVWCSLVAVLQHPAQLVDPFSSRVVHPKQGLPAKLWCMLGPPALEPVLQWGSRQGLPPGLTLEAVK